MSEKNGLNTGDFVVFDSFKNMKSSYENAPFSLVPSSKPKEKSNSDYINGLINEVSRYSERSVKCLKAAQKEENNIESLSWAAYLLEKSIENVRKIASFISSGDEETVKSKSKNPFRISVDIAESYICFEMPLLMPKRKANLKTDYYNAELDHALHNISLPEQYLNSNVAIIFLHCYNREHAKWLKKDHDNIDVKWFVDALNNHFFIDDGPFRTSLYHHSTVDKTDHTYVYLVPIEQLPEFLKSNIPAWEMQKRDIN